MCGNHILLILVLSIWKSWGQNVQSEGRYQTIRGWKFRSALAADTAFPPTFCISNRPCYFSPFTVIYPTNSAFYTVVYIYTLFYYSHLLVFFTVSVGHSLSFSCFSPAGFLTFPSLHFVSGTISEQTWWTPLSSRLITSEHSQPVSVYTYN